MTEEKSVRLNRQWILKERPQDGALDTSKIFEQTAVPIENLTKGQALAKVMYLSFDPTMRGWISRDGYMPAQPLGEPMRALGVAQVIESKTASFHPGDIVLGGTGWQEYVVLDDAYDGPGKMAKLPSTWDPRLSMAIALTGVTAYFGMTDVGKIKAGDTVLVSGAAGATGSVAAQMASILGAKQVVGIAGGPEKCRWLTEEAKLDAAIDYKNENLGERLQELFPHGIDLYFDNVGGETLDTVLQHLALHARIVLCGAISQYNIPKADLYGLKNTKLLVEKRATMHGFLVLDYMNRSTEALLALNDWIESKQMVLKIDEQNGFENIPSTLDRLFCGANMGKQLLKLSDPPLAKNSSLIENIVMKVLSLIYRWKRRR